MLSYKEMGHSAIEGTSFLSSTIPYSFREVMVNDSLGLMVIVLSPIIRFHDFDDFLLHLKEFMLLHIKQYHFYYQI